MEHPLVASMRYTWYPSNPYAWLDFIVGLLLGAWKPVMYNYHGNDCFASHVNMGFGIYSYASYFDKAWSNGAFDWITLILSAAFTGFDIYTGVTNCLNQLEYSTNE
jgi:hypothetical protein